LKLLPISGWESNPQLSDSLVSGPARISARGFPWLRFYALEVTDILSGEIGR
jgi:hypothetical protein